MKHNKGRRSSDLEQSSSSYMSVLMRGLELNDYVTLLKRVAKLEEDVKTLKEEVSKRVCNPIVVRGKNELQIM